MRNNFLFEVRGGPPYYGYPAHAIMASHGRETSGVIGAYQKYKADARGWGVPEFKVFRERLWPLRNKRDKEKWPDDDMILVMTLQEEGAGYALYHLFTDRGRTNPVATEILGEAPFKPEPVSRDELDPRIQALVRDCKSNGWSPGEFMAYIDYLDGDRTVAGPKSAGDEKTATPAQSGSGSGNIQETAAQPERDAFAEVYRAAGKGYKRRVREALAAGAGR